MDLDEVRSAIEDAWDQREALDAAASDSIRNEVDWTIAALDAGELRAAEKRSGEWVVNQWVKKAVVLSFAINDMELVEGGPGGATWWDKVPPKFARWTDREFRNAGFRAVPGSIVRRGAFIGRAAVLMPSFVNIGAHVGAGTMVDTWASVGSCAQVGENCHLSGGVGLGGVLEPLQANPTIIEDNCFIGARSEVVERVIVGKGSVLSMGVFITASTKIVDRATGKILRGHVPPLLGCRARHTSRCPVGRWHCRTLVVVCSHRQARGRTDAVEDVGQRASPRLTRCLTCTHPADVGRPTNKLPTPLRRLGIAELPA